MLRGTTRMESTLGPFSRFWATRCCSVAVGLAVLLLGSVGTYGVALAQEDVDASWLSAILQDDAIPFDVRVGAAHRMAVSKDGDVTAALVLVVESANGSCLEALAAGVRQAGRLSEPVVAAIIANACEAGSMKSEHRAMLQVGAEDAVEALQEMALEPESPCRMIAIKALGAMKTRVAAESLIQLLSVLERDAEEIEAIDAALRLYAGGERPRTPDAWRVWWRTLNSPETSGQSVALLEEQRADAIRRAEAAEARAELLSRRLAASLERLLAVVPDEEREAQIIELARDSEPASRLVAVAQVERMLLNGRSPSDELKEAMLERLEDVDPTIRSMTARLLDAMGLEDLGARLVAAISRENEPEVQVAMFVILGNRPVPAIVPLAAACFSKPLVALSDAAAGAVVAVARAGLLDDEARTVVWEGLALRSEGVNTRALATVAVLIADNPDTVSELLSSIEPVVRIGAAEGLRVLGEREALLRVAADPLLAPVAIVAWTDPPITLASIDALLSLEPPIDREEDRLVWQDAMEAVLAGLPAVSVVVADEVLEGHPDFFPAVRLALHRAATTEDLELATREAAARWLAARLIARDQPLEAAAELRAAGASATSALGDELFEALVLGKSWDDAAAIRWTEEPWLKVLQSTAALRPEFAVLLAAEIKERFKTPKPTPESSSTAAAEDSR